jgi:hypothetical protein
MGTKPGGADRRAAGVDDLHDGYRFAFVKIRLGVCMRDRHANR